MEFYEQDDGVCGRERETWLRSTLQRMVLEAIMSTYLITGSTGTVGKGVVEALTAQGHSVRAATRAPEKYEGLGIPTRLDISKRSTFSAAVDGVDAVFVMSPAGYADAAAALGPLVEFAGARVPRIVTMTAQGVQHDDAIPLRQLELMVEATKASFIHLRPSWFSQNFNSFWLPPILEAGVIPLPAAEAKTAFVDARDISATIAAVLQNDAFDGRGWELTGPEALTYAEAATVLSEISGRPISYAPIDDDTFLKNLSATPLPVEYQHLLVALFQAVRAGSASTVTEGVLTLTGKAPRRLADYARDHRDVWAPK